MGDTWNYAVAVKRSDGYVLHLVHTGDGITEIVVMGLPPSAYHYTVSTITAQQQDMDVLHLM